jgi:hypothetical protein
MLFIKILLFVLLFLLFILKLFQTGEFECGQIGIKGSFIPCSNDCKYCFNDDAAVGDLEAENLKKKEGTDIMYISHSKMHCLFIEPLFSSAM